MRTTRFCGFGGEMGRVSEGGIRYPPDILPPGCPTPRCPTPGCPTPRCPISQIPCPLDTLPLEGTWYQGYPTTNTLPSIPYPLDILPPITYFTDTLPKIPYPKIPSPPYPPTGRNMGPEIAYPL